MTAITTIGITIASIKGSGDFSLLGLRGLEVVVDIVDEMVLPPMPSVADVDGSIVTGILSTKLNSLTALSDLS